MCKFQTTVLTVFIVISAIACANHNQLAISKDSTPDDSEKNAVLATVTSPEFTEEVKKYDIKSPKPNLSEISKDGGIKEFVLNEVSSNWLGEDGNTGSLTDKSKQKLISQLLPAGKKQFDLGYNAQISKHAEDLSEVNVVKTIIESEGRKKTFKTYLESAADKKIAAALANAKTAAINVCRNAGKLEFIDNIVSGQLSVESDCQENILRVLLTINKSASQKADLMMQPLYESKYKNEKPDL